MSYVSLTLRPFVRSFRGGAAQVLRYNASQAYVVHFDYLEKAEGHNFESEGLGTNRFATVRCRRVNTGSLCVGASDIASEDPSLVPVVACPRKFQYARS